MNRVACDVICLVQVAYTSGYLLLIGTVYCVDRFDFCAPPSDEKAPSENLGQVIIISRSSWKTLGIL